MSAAGNLVMLVSGVFGEILFLSSVVDRRLLAKDLEQWIMKGIFILMFLLVNYSHLNLQTLADENWHSKLKYESIVHWQLRDYVNLLCKWVLQELFSPNQNQLYAH